MSGVLTERRDGVSSLHDELDGPAHGHIAACWEPEVVALCGKKLLGYPAPSDAPNCPVCEALWAAA